MCSTSRKTGSRQPTVGRQGKRDGGGNEHLLTHIQKKTCGHWIKDRALKGSEIGYIGNRGSRHVVSSSGEA